MNMIDKPRQVREGEELDLPAVEAFLKQNIPGLTGTLEAGQFQSGYSNLTYLLKMGDREFVLRRPPHGTKAATAHDMSREYTIQKLLKPVFPYCPEVFAYCDDPGVIGGPFYVMERVRGIILRKDLPEGMTLSPEQARMLCEKLLDVHVALHTIDYAAAGLADFGKPEGYVRRQVEGWSRRYRNALTPDAPDFEKNMNWLAENMPLDSPHPAVIHNDYRFDNVVLDPDDPMKIIAVLDWEMATIGDPLMDLGNSLAYWIQADDPEEFHMMRLLPTNIPGALTRDEMVQRYAEKTGRPIEKFDWYLAFGMFRLAVIAQQIYYRFYHGQTKNEKFRMLVFGVHLLDKATTALIEKA